MLALDIRKDEARLAVLQDVVDLALRQPSVERDDYGAYRRTRLKSIRYDGDVWGDDGHFGIALDTPREESVGEVADSPGPLQISPGPLSLELASV